MGIFRPHIISDQYSVGIWNITESLEELTESVRSRKFNLKGQESITSELKKKQWLAARMLLHSMEPNIREVRYLNSKAPEVDGFDISFSHSAYRVCVMLSQSAIPGIDIQEIHRKILRVKEKFASPEELEMAGPVKEVEKLHLIWCAKEAIYKQARIPGLIFSEDIRIHPIEMQSMGRLKAEVRLNNLWTAVNLQYEFIDNYALVYTLIG
jgi:phosphopantetheinyl transferase